MKELTKEEAIKELRKYGWNQLWHENYWVHTTIMAGGNLDYCGLDLEGAILCNNKHRNTNFKLK